MPMRLGKPLEHIPFVFHGPTHSLPHVDKLPLADIIAVNLDHYRLNADYKHGLHFTALPTAYLSGFDKKGSFPIGSSAAWVPACESAPPGTAPAEIRRGGGEDALRFLEKVLNRTRGICVVSRSFVWRWC
jgi:hypothetical protein